MWTDKESVKNKLDSYLVMGEILKAFFEEADKSPVVFRMNMDSKNLEIGLSGTDDIRACRVWMKVFKADSRRFCAFFYKKSNVPHSTDRFAYGAVLFEAERLTALQINEFLSFLSSYFDPSNPPKNLKRAFAFTVPDD